MVKIVKITVIISNNIIDIILLDIIWNIIMNNDHVIRKKLQRYNYSSVTISQIDFIS